MSEPTAPPATGEELRTAILERYNSLSKRLRQIARYVLDEPNELALETLTVIADRCGAQPSAIIRFAKTFGYDGATQMQRLFREDLLAGHAGLAYGDRVRQFNEVVTTKAASGPAEILAEFVEGDTLALQSLSQTVGDAEMREAVEMIDKADIVYVVGFRRSFPVASYLAYSLQQVKKRTLFVDGAAGLSGLQMQTIDRKDLLIAVSYHPYAPETVKAVEAAVLRGAKVLTISDSVASPIAMHASLALRVREAEVRGFRSLAASICVAQALVIAFAFESSRGKRPVAKRRRTA